jgi:hypothetical protein
VDERRPGREMSSCDGAAWRSGPRLENLGREAGDQVWHRFALLYRAPQVVTDDASSALAVKSGGSLGRNETRTRGTRTVPAF